MSRRRSIASFKSPDVKRRASVTQVDESDDIALGTSGFMEKQATGMFGKKWQKRFFAVEGDFLKYYNDDKKKVMKGALDLKCLVTCRLAPTGKEDECELILELMALPDGENGEKEEEKANHEEKPSSREKELYMMRGPKYEAQRWHDALKQYVRESNPQKFNKMYHGRKSFTSRSDSYKSQASGGDEKSDKISENPSNNPDGKKDEADMQEEQTQVQEGVAMEDGGGAAEQVESSKPNLGVMITPELQVAAQPFF
jgi:hypothetical protein